MAAGAAIFPVRGKAGAEPIKGSVPRRDGIVGRSASILKRPSPLPGAPEPVDPQLTHITGTQETWWDAA
jgi:hypothetical protein